MNRVKNRRVLNRIADKTRKAGKGKSLIAVLAIAMISVLFTSVFTVGGSMIKKQQKSKRPGVFIQERRSDRRVPCRFGKAAERSAVLTGRCLE